MRPLPRRACRRPHAGDSLDGVHGRGRYLLLAALALASCARRDARCPVEADCPAETPPPCHTVVRGTFSRITLSLDADPDGGAPIRVISDRGEERTLGAGPVSFDDERGELVLRAVGGSELELRFDVVGDEPAAVVGCTPHCEVETKSTRTGHDTGEAESSITLPPSFGGRVVRMTARLSISVAECH